VSVILEFTLWSSNSGSFVKLIQLRGWHNVNVTASTGCVAFPHDIIDMFFFFFQISLAS